VKCLNWLCPCSFQYFRAVALEYSNRYTCVCNGMAVSHRFTEMKQLIPYCQMALWVSTNLLFSCPVESTRRIQSWLFFCILSQRPPSCVRHRRCRKVLLLQGIWLKHQWTLKGLLQGWNISSALFLSHPLTVFAMLCLAMSSCLTAKAAINTAVFVGRIHEESA